MDDMSDIFSVTLPTSHVAIHYAKPEIRKELVDQCINRFKPLLENCTGGWVAGGAVRDFFAREETESDIDLFFQHSAALKLAVDNFEVVLNLRKLYDNDSVIAYKWRNKVVQLIKKYYFTDAKECIKSFDFTVCSCAVDLNGVYVHDMFFQDLAGRRLAINSLPFPLATLERLQKYIEKGYKACNGTLLEIARGIQTTNLASGENSLQFYPDGSPRFVRFD